MSSSKRWWVRAGAALTAFVVTMLMPVVVWAESSGVAELARRRRPRGGIGAFGFLGALCCLVVVAGIVVVVVLATRRNRRNGGH